MPLDPALRARILTMQRNELTECHIYRKLAAAVPAGAQRDVLTRIADDEMRHYEVWRAFTGQESQPDRLKIWWYYLVSRLLGLTFGIKLMEQGEAGAQHNYSALAGLVPDVERISKEENEHEHALIAMIDEDLLRYTGSMVLGLNDALVELTGALAGLTLALQNTRLIALTGLITGLAAALSMASSEYLSTKTESEGETKGKSPLKAAVYTGAAYVVTVVLLIAPYLLLGHFLVCLAVTFAIAVAIIFIFNYYISVAQDLPFRKRFIEMTALSFGVATLSFGIGFLVNKWLGVAV